MRGMPSGGQEGGAATIKTAQCAQRVLRCSLHGRTAGVAGAPPHHHDSFLSAAPSLLPAASLAASFASWCSFSCQWNSLDTSLRAAAVGTAVAGGGDDESVGGRSRHTQTFSCQWNSLDTSLRAAAVGTAVAGGGDDESVGGRSRHTQTFSCQWNSSDASLRAAAEHRRGGWRAKALDLRAQGLWEVGARQRSARRRTGM